MALSSPWAQRLPFPQVAPGGGHAGHESASPLPQASLPWHIRGAPGQPEPEGHRAPPRGTWPWPPALLPAPPPRPPHFRPKRGEPPDSRWTFPGAAALPGVQMGGCCPGSWKRTSGRGRIPPGWEKGWAQQVGSLVCFCWGEGTSWELSLQPVSPTLSHRPLSKEVAGVTAPTHTHPHPRG